MNQSVFSQGHLFHEFIFMLTKHFADFQTPVTPQIPDCFFFSLIQETVMSTTLSTDMSKISQKIWC